MSSFVTPHRIFLFEMVNGKKKAGYGPSPGEAYERLGLRLTTMEMAQVRPDKFERVSQREFRKHIHELG